MATTEQRNAIELEIRLAMQQEKFLSGALDRASVAEIRAGRILSIMEKIPLTSLLEVPQTKVDEVTRRLVRG